jgi:hypothetical protein
VYEFLIRGAVDLDDDRRREAVRGFPPRCDDTHAAQVLVVDFVDDFDRRAGDDSERRVQEYRRMGMDVGVPAGAQ